MIPSNQLSVLVTGGSGYIGSCLVKKAIAAGYTIHVLDNAAALPKAVAELFHHPCVNHFKGDITDRKALEESVQGVAHVVHLAGISDGRAGKANPALTQKVNTESIAQIVDVSKAAGVKKFVFASTMGVYGNGYHSILNEALPLNPLDPYSESKALGEAVVKAAASPTFCPVSLRIAMVYGVGPKIREDFLVNNLCLNAVLQGRLSIMGGLQRRPQIHIDDLARLVLDLLSCDTSDICGAAFNAVGQNPSILEMVDVLKGLLPDLEVDILPARNYEDSFEMDGQKLFESIGFRPMTDLKTGIRGLVDHYQTAGVTN
jgi:nucleoside-diphosphate-sugar epimerase